MTDRLHQYHENAIQWLDILSRLDSCARVIDEYIHQDGTEGKEHADRNWQSMVALLQQFRDIQNWWDNESELAFARSWNRLSARTGDSPVVTMCGRESTSHHSLVAELCHEIWFHVDSAPGPINDWVVSNVAERLAIEHREWSTIRRRLILELAELVDAGEASTRKTEKLVPDGGDKRKKFLPL